MVATHEGIVLTPSPVNLRSLAAQSKLYICPMDAGGGLKLRIMDGLRAGQPILVHQRAARGYDQLINMPFFAIYNDVNSFRTQLIKLVHYLQSDAYSRLTIQNQYYQLFGKEIGLERLKTILDKEA